MVSIRLAMSEVVLKTTPSVAMTPGRLLLRSLRYHLGMHATVVLGVAVGTAVLTGALLVGDSVKGSLRELALDRLGDVDHALVTGRYFREALAEDLLRADYEHESIRDAAPAIFIRGAAQNANTGARASQINIHGVDERFLALFGTSVSLPESRKVLLNEVLAREIGVEVGDSLLLRFQADTLVPSELVMGRRGGNVRTLRLEVSAVLGNRGLGRFGLSANQRLPLNIFLPLGTLQRALDQEGRVNAILTTDGTLSDETAIPNKKYQSRVIGVKPHSLNQLLASSLELDDLNLRLTTGADGVILLETDRIVLEAPSASAADRAALAVGMSTVPVLTYLANRMTLDERSVPYSTVASLGSEYPELSGLRLVNGQRVPRLEAGEILLNEWAANDLRASVGDRLVLDYYVVDSQGTLDTKEHQFTIKGVVRIEGLAADRRLTPIYKGMSTAKRMEDWDPPFPVDLGLIREIDERYWDRYRATPKAFISFGQAKKLWTNRFGQLTSVRVAVPQGQSVTKATSEFEAELKRCLDPSAHGFVFRPVKEEALNASSGATDFSGLFIGFSMFLIVSAAMLVTLLFQLGVERRSHEIGLLLATGQTVSTVRQLLLRESVLLTAVGCLVGIPGAIGYGMLMVHGLSTWWSDAIGGSFLQLYVTAKSLVTGTGGTFALMVLAVWLSVKKFTSLSPRLMLARAAPKMLITTEGTLSGKRARKVAWVCAGLASLGFGVGLVQGGAWTAGAFFGVGALLMISALAYFRHRLLQPFDRMTTGAGGAKITRLGIRNGARYPTRSVLSAALVASATFVITAVAMNRHNVSSQEPALSSGDGGFRWIAESDSPLYKDQFVQLTGLPAMEVFLLRVMPGEDASCLNLYRPSQPRVSSVSREMISRGGFAFEQTLANTLEETENPWLLLEAKTKNGAIPVFGDANSIMWILHLGLGDTLEIKDELGRPRHLVIAGLLSRSIFQSQLILSEKYFLEMFPGHSGYNQFLIETDSNSAGVLLEAELADQGFDAATTADRLARYLVVENTYMSTFQTLGGLGLLLGTLGLAVVMVRNILERKRELALLQVVGFSERTISWLVLAENGFLLVLGVLIGSVTALLATAPHLLGKSSEPPWVSLALTLSAIVVVGLSAGVVSVAVALRTSLIASLRRD